jgi:uncharacterized membrane protein
MAPTPETPRVPESAAPGDRPGMLADVARSPAARLATLDTARGLALALMVAGHAAYFAKVPLRGEVFAGRPLPMPEPFWIALAVLGNFGPALFWLAMGVGVALLDRRRAGAGSPERFLLGRGIGLLLLDRLVETFLWNPRGPIVLRPGFDLLSGLGLSLLLLIPVRRLSDRALAMLIGVLALGYPLLIHGIPQARLESLPLALRVLVTYDGVHVPKVTFPLLGWFIAPALGLLLGRRLGDPAWQRPQRWWLAALGCWAIGIASRVTGYGDYSPWTPADGWLRWFVQSKGPPGLDFMALGLGTSLVWIGILHVRRVDHARLPWSWLGLLGRVPLFLYVAHLAVLWPVSRPLLRLLPAQDGPRWALTTLVALAVLTPIAAWYRALKSRYPGSVLRYL